LFLKQKIKNKFIAIENYQLADFWYTGATGSCSTGMLQVFQQI